MSKSCGVISPETNHALNQLAKEYKDSGLTNEEARKQAANDLLAAIKTPTLGSTSNTRTDNAQKVWEKRLPSDSIYDIYIGLDSVIGSPNRVEDSPEHSKRLRSLMDTLIAPAMMALDGYKVVAETWAGETKGVVDISQKKITVSVGMAPVLNSLMLSAQETFLHETVHAITSTVNKLTGETDLKGSFQLRQGVRKLFNLAKANITWQDLVQEGKENDPLEQEAAKERWSYIFESRHGLEEFVAFGNTNEKFIKLLQGINVGKEKTTDGTLWDGIKDWFVRAIDWLANRTMHVENTNVALALQNLTKEIAGIKHKHFNVLSVLGKGGEYARYAVAKPVELALRSLSAGVKALPENRATKVIKGIAAFPIAAKTQIFLQGMSYVADALVTQREWFFVNMMAKLPQELIGMTEDNKRFYALLRQSKGVIDVERHKIKESVLVQYKEAFKTLLSKDEDDALSTLISTDMDDLITQAGLTYEDITDLLKNPSKQKSLIKKHSDNLLNKYGSVAHGYIRQAKGLGMFMVRRETFNHGNQKLNPYAIARMDFDPSVSKKLPNDWEAAEKDISVLKTLYAIQYTNPDTLKKVLGVMDREFAADPKENGIIELYAMVSHHREEALRMNFDGNKSLMRSGYGAEIYNPNVMIKISTNPNDKELLDSGYTTDSKPLKQDKKLKHTPMYLYVSNNGGLTKYTKEIISLTSRQKFGTDLFDIHLTNGKTGKDARDAADKDTQDVLSNLRDIYSDKYDEKDTTNLIPVSNENGRTVGFRYTMSEENKYKYLQKDYRASVMVATMFERMTDKYNTIPFNRKVVKELQNDYKEFKLKKAKDFITITQDHPKYGELYKRLPDEMKKDLDEVFGKGKIIVREPMVDIIFGYNNWSLTTDGLNDSMGSLILSIFTGMGMNRGKVIAHMALAEHAWQDTVSLVKNTIVLKTLVLPFNILSNYYLSFMMGMPLDYITKRQAEAISALKSYNNNYRRLLILKRQQKAIGITQDKSKEIEGKIKQLQFDIDNNPITPMLGQGMLNAIVEDINLDIDGYSMQSKFYTWIDKKTEKVPRVAKDIYEQVQVGEKTGLYNFLATATRYSDFVARYAMYRFYTEEKGYSKEEALKETMEAFIEYDPPTSKELQYLNDMGLAIFTKYAIRVQKVLVRMALNRPDSLVGLYILENILGYRIPEPTESFIPNWNTVVGGFDEVAMPGPRMVMDYADAVGDIVIPN